MFFKLLTIFFFSLLFQSSSKTLNFTYDGFPQRSYISIQGIAAVTPNGLLRLTNTTVQQTGHAFYNKSIRLKNSPNGTVSSFSTTFVFAIHPRIPGLSGHGIAFVIAPNTRLPYATPSQYMGLFNITSNGNKTNHVFAIELDTIRSTEFNDINDNHVGIDINSLTSVKSVEDRASNVIVLKTGNEDREKMGHGQHKPKQQTCLHGPEFKTRASQRLCENNEDKKQKSKVQGQTMTIAKTEEHNGLKLSNRFAALDL